jgi:hypothetical protein
VHYFPPLPTMTHGSKRLPAFDLHYGAHTGETFAPPPLRRHPTKLQLLGLLLAGTSLLFSSRQLLFPPSEMVTPPLNLIVVAPTFYSSVEESRFILGLDACRQAALRGIRLILVDGSPQEEIRTALRNAGKNHQGKSLVRVIPQVVPGKKGVALREAIRAAVEEFDSAGLSCGHSVIAFQELEKVDMFRHWKSVANHMAETGAGITCPRREDSLFKSTYPIEQYYAESFADFYQDSLGSRPGLPSIHWTIGPMALRCTLSNHWLDFDGQIWDAQLVPMLHAFLSGAKVSSFEIDYRHSELMKQQEEGQPEWSEKRLLQLNHLFEKLGKILKESAAKA